MRVLSGIQPSGALHLGNYFSMMKRMIEYQKNSSLFCFIASYHAMSSVRDKDALKKNILDAAMDFLALGIDPEQSTFWVQSDVPEVTELTWMLSMCINVSQLELAHSYKDKVAQGINPSAGLMYYPILMAADILLFGGEKVPVGKDQKQHLEFTRDICLKFNNTYGETFILPEPDILSDTATVPGIDGRKMSKSYNNTINFFADEKKLKKSVMAIVTDSTPVEEPKSTENSVLFDIYSLFLKENEIDTLKTRFQTPGEGYGHFKLDLYNKILEHFTPFRDKRNELERRQSYVIDILNEGAKKARAVAVPFLERARSVTGLSYKI